jgi:hypothetical protein
MMRLPEFIVAGAPKCGTTWLHQCLTEHPDIFLPTATKEIFFFDRYWDRGTEWYAEYFRGAPRKMVCGEISPTYLSAAEAPRRIRQLLPNSRIVFLLRNPIARAISNYHHLVSKGETRLPFEGAINQHPGIVTDGYYDRHITRYAEQFGDDVLLTLILEQLHSPDDRGLAPLFRFLGVAEEFIPPSLHEPVYARRAPRGYHIAALTAWLSGLLHHRGLHHVVEAGKRVGLERLVFKREPGPRAEVSEACLQMLRAKYRPDSEKLGQRLGVDLTALWRLD